MISIIKYITLPYSIIIANIAVLEKGSRGEIYPEGAKLAGKRKASFSKRLET